MKCYYFTMRQEELKYFPEFAKRYGLNEDPRTIMPDCADCSGEKDSMERCGVSDGRLVKILGELE